MKKLVIFLKRSLSKARQVYAFPILQNYLNLHQFKNNKIYLFMDRPVHIQHKELIKLPQLVSKLKLILPKKN